MQTVEFIESYKKVGNDYQWHDNHGQLVRCRDCKHYKEGPVKAYNTKTGEELSICSKHTYGVPTNNDNWYCADGERKEG